MTSIALGGNIHSYYYSQFHALYCFSRTETNPVIFRSRVSIDHCRQQGCMIIFFIHQQSMAGAISDKGPPTCTKHTPRTTIWSSLLVTLASFPDDQERTCRATSNGPVVANNIALYADTEVDKDKTSYYRIDRYVYPLMSAHAKMHPSSPSGVQKIGTEVTVPSSSDLAEFLLDFQLLIRYHTIRPTKSDYSWRPHHFLFACRYLA